MSRETVVYSTDLRPSERLNSSHSNGNLRIAYLFMRYPSAVQPFAISDVKALSALGHRVDAYALSRRDPQHAALLSGYQIELPERSHMSWRTLIAPFRPANWSRFGRLLMLIARHHQGWRPTLSALALAPRIVEIAAELTETRPDVVHAFWGHYPSLVIPLVTADQPRCVGSMFLGAYDLTSHLSPFSGPAAEYCRTVWTHSEENRATLFALGIAPGKVRVVHRGIPLDLADGPMPAREPLRICTAANLQKEKNVDLILKVFQRVLRDIPEATLVIAGDGEEMANLKALAAELGIAEHVDFTGLLRRDELFREMARARVFLYLSTKVSERLPNAVKEAMLAGCHCVVSETPGIRELIEPGRTGDVLDDLDADNVAERVRQIFTSGPTAVGDDAAQFIRDHLSSNASMQRYVDAWRRELAAAD